MKILWTENYYHSIPYFHPSCAGGVRMESLLYCTGRGKNLNLAVGEAILSHVHGSANCFWSKSQKSFSASLLLFW